MNSRQSSIEELVEKRAWPEGGLQAVYKEVVKRIPKYECMAAGEPVVTVEYNSFMQLLCTAAYLSPQGRISALKSVTFQQAPELLEGTDILSTVFKTHVKYGFQVVTTCIEFRKLLSIYLNIFRPQGLADQPTSPLFISFEGGLFGFGRAITAFCKDALGIHVTSTTFRAMMETGAGDLEEVDIIVLC